ncbi:MAG: SpoIIIAH-like family protein, partial [Bacilli bacterium]
SEIEDVLAASYEDAVVFTNKGSVEVIVKTSDLTAAQADEIIQLVRNEMDVASASITVSAKAE